MRDTLYRLLLATLLLASQYSLAAHQIDIAHHDGTPCAICVVGHSLDHAAAGNLNLAAIAPRAEYHAPGIARFSLYCAPARQAARSPPVISLHPSIA